MIELSHIHPMLVHFPIALVVFGFVADFAYLLYKKEACLSKTGFYLLVAGTLSAMVALLTVALLTATSVFRIFLMAKNREDSNLKWIAFVLYGIATFSVSLTGFFGGTLVYNYMMPL